MEKETIAAPATAMSDSGIGIIRVSGAHAVAIIGKVFPKIKEMESHTISYGFIKDGDEILDEVMVSLMRGPRSYTREDVVEINCHGGVMMMSRILHVILKSGARLAEPGEFTKRAFLNGRIDLAKAEAVMDVIRSKNEFALKSSVRQLRGGVSTLIRSLREDIIYQLALIESALDDPEHISLEGYAEKLLMKVEEIVNHMDSLLKSCEDGKVLKEGINTVIIGKPNVGKSSFLNFLSGEERAIVTDIAGTTRDVLTESVRLGEITLNLIDTAGIRSTEDRIEKIGVERAKQYALDADFIIYIVDSSVSLDENDKEIINFIRNKKLIVLMNKTDLEGKVTEKEIVDYFNSSGFLTHESYSHVDDNFYPQVDKWVDRDNQERNSPIIIQTSIKENIGFDFLKQTITDLFFSGKIQSEEEIYITNMRHKEALQNAYESMLLVRKSIKDHMPVDLFTIDLMSAYESLGFIIGEQIEEDLVNEIFSKFCTGK